MSKYDPEYSRQYGLKHREKLREYYRWYYQAHKEQMNERRRRCRLEHKEREREYNRQYALAHKEELRNYYRKRRLFVDGKQVFGLNKRDYPHDNKCELCKEVKEKLDYHHWDGKNLSKGIWVCFVCHQFVEGLEKGLNPERYFSLKRRIDEVMQDCGEWMGKGELPSSSREGVSNPSLLEAAQPSTAIIDEEIRDKGGMK